VVPLGSSCLYFFLFDVLSLLLCGLGIVYFAASSCMTFLYCIVLMLATIGLMMRVAFARLWLIRTLLLCRNQCYLVGY
jgi:hypothetical protein